MHFPNRNEGSPELSRTWIEWRQTSCIIIIHYNTSFSTCCNCPRNTASRMREIFLITISEVQEKRYLAFSRIIFDLNGKWKLEQTANSREMQSAKKVKQLLKKSSCQCLRQVIKQIRRPKKVTKVKDFFYFPCVSFLCVLSFLLFLWYCSFKRIATSLLN